MAITRRWQAGAEVDTTNSWAMEFDSRGDSGFAPSTGAKKSGAYSYVWRISDTYGLKAIPATRQIRVGFHWRPGTSPTYSAVEIFRICGAAIGNNLVALTGTAASYNLNLTVAGVVQDTKIASHQTDTWIHIGIDVKIDNAAGWAKVYADGVEILSFAGNTGNSDIQNVAIGNAGSEHWGSSNYTDDIYVDDTTGEAAAAAPPDLRFEFLTPDADGNYSDWDGSDGNQINNFEQVDERPHDSETTYNEAQAADEQDSYAMTTYAVGAGWEIKAVIPTATARKTNAGVGTLLQMFLRVGSDDALGPAGEQALGSSYGLVWDRHTAAPDAGAWTQADLDALEVGIEGEGAFS